MRTFSLLAILTVISSTLSTSAAPLLLAVDVGATVDASVRRDLAANRVSGVRRTLESLHGRGDITSSAKRDSTREAVGARSISVFALTKRFGNLVHGSALADTAIEKHQPQPITDLNIQARTGAQVDAVAILKRDPATVEARAGAQVDAAVNVDLHLKRDPVTVEARTQAQVDAAANVDLLLKRDPATVG